MKVMVYTKPREMRIEERPYPTLQPGEVILKIDLGGVEGEVSHVELAGHSVVFSKSVGH